MPCSPYGTPAFRKHQGKNGILGVQLACISHHITCCVVIFEVYILQVQTSMAHSSFRSVPSAFALFVDESTTYA